MDKQYKEMIRFVLKNGTKRSDRTGTGTISVFGYQNRYDLRQGFPIQTTKKIHWKSVIGELLWMLSGSTSAKELREKYDVKIWDEWQDDKGELGPIYGSQWRNNDNDGPDQILDVIDLIRSNPNDRGIIVNAWNPHDLYKMKLRPCHTMFQFYVDGDELDLQLYQRSCDLFLGCPFNISSYSLLLSMIAQVTNKKPRYFIHSFGDLHIYQNHMQQVCEVLSRDYFPLPRLELNKTITNIDDFKVEDIKLVSYQSHPAIRAEVAI